VIDALNTHGHRDLKAVEIWKLFQELIEAHRRQDHEWAVDCPEQYKRSAFEVRVGDLRGCVVSTTTRKMATFARAYKGNDIVVSIDRKTGNVFIGSADEQEHVMHSIAAALVVVEGIHAGKADEAIAEDLLELSAIIAGGRDRDLPMLDADEATYWHYFLLGGSLLNGSRGHAQTATPLSLGELLTVLVTGLNMSEGLSANDVNDRLVGAIVTARGGAERGIDAKFVRDTFAAIDYLCYDLFRNPEEGEVV